MAKQKNSAAVALSRLGAKKGGHARAAKLTPAQRSESARDAVQARWAKAKGRAIADQRGNAVAKKFSRSHQQTGALEPVIADTSDQAVLGLLQRIKATDDPTEIRRLADQLEHVIFHKQFRNAPA